MRSHRSNHLDLRPVSAFLISLLVPGLGQIMAGRHERGAVILIAAIVVGNLNIIWLSLFATTRADPHTL